MREEAVRTKGKTQTGEMNEDMQCHLLFRAAVPEAAGSKVSLSFSAVSPEDPMITAAFTERPRVQ